MTQSFRDLGTYVADFQESSKGKPLNVICIMMDTWRTDYVESHPKWNSWVDTPGISQLVSDSTIFENAYAESVPTLPARMSLFTGRYNFPFRPWQRLENNDLLLSDLLDYMGYETALISDTNPMRLSNYMMGFRYVEWSDNSGLDTRGPRAPKAVFDINKYYKDRGDSRDAYFRKRLQKELEVSLTWKSDEESYVAQTVKKAMKWLERKRVNDTFFLWLDTWDPHEAWDPPSPFDTMYLDSNYDGSILLGSSPGTVDNYLEEDELQCIKALYAGEVNMCDKWLGIFLEKLDELGFFENTLIVFLTDHGTYLGERNLIHKARCWPYEEISHIPLIIRHPKAIGKGKNVKAFVDTTDIMPTILDFLGVKLMPPRSSHEMLHGHSLLPLMSGEIELVREYAHMGWFNCSWAVRDERWKYIIFGPNFTYTGKKENELYNLEDDPEEQKNLFQEEPEIVDSLELELRRFVQRLPPPQPSTPIQIKGQQPWR